MPRLSIAQWRQQQREPYAASWFQHLLYCFWRQFLLVSRDKVFLRSRAVQAVVMGLLAGSLYFDLEFAAVRLITPPSHFPRSRAINKSSSSRPLRFKISSV